MNKPHLKTAQWQLISVAMVGVAVAVAIFGVVYHFESRSNLARFNDLARQQIIAIRANISIALDSVSLIAGHFAIAPSDTTSRSDFAAMVRKAVEGQAFVQGFSWDPRVRRDELPDFERQARLDGMTTFFVAERDAAGKLQPVSERPEYFPVYYMEPMATNGRAIGFDLGSNPVRKAALDTARDSGEAQTTGRITLVQEKGHQFGVLVLAPAIARGSDGSKEMNAELLKGYVSGVFRLGDLINSSVDERVGGVVVPLVDIYLFDMDAPEGEQRLFPASGDATLTSLSSDRTVLEDVEIGGRHWRLVATPSEAFIEGSRPFASIIMLIASLVASALLYAVLKGRIDREEKASAYAREMARSQQQLNASQDMARLASVEYDIAGRVCNINDRIAAMFGLQTEGAVCTVDALLKCVHPDDRDCVLKLLAQLNNETGYDIRIGHNPAFRTVHGAVREMDRGNRLLLTFQDISLRKENEEKTRRLERELLQSQKLEAIGTLAGGIAHELNTPIQFIGDNLAFISNAATAFSGVIKSYKNIIDQDKAEGDVGELKAEVVALEKTYDLNFLEEELPNAINQSREGVSQISNLVTAMKEFSHPTSKAKAPVNINRIAERVATICRSEWKGVATMSFDLEEELPVVKADEGQLNQVVLNLIVNAAHAIQEKDNGLGQIRLKTRSNSEGITLTVEDTGTGIPDHLRIKVFEPFFTTKEVGKGTGQGLSIAWDIVVNKHGGRIVCDNKHPFGTGVAFSVFIPFEAAQSEAA